MTSLRRLAAELRVLTSYYGVEGLSRATPEALVAVLKTLGAPIERVEDADDALRLERSRRARKTLDPVVVLWEGSPRTIPLRGGASAPSAIELVVTSEDGRTWGGRHDATSLPVSRAAHGKVIRHLPLPDLPLGYHHLGLTANGATVESLLIHAPRRGYRPSREPEEGQRWGLFAPLYALRSSDSWGAGDFADLGRLAELVALHHGDVVASLPLFATFVDEPSPYSPVSRRYWNELYTSLVDLPEWRTGFIDAALSERVGALRRAPLVDYDAFAATKRPVMERLAREARRLRPSSFAAFAQRRPEAIDYARFRAACEVRRAHWTDWENASPDETELDDDRTLYHFYGQMVAEEQIALVSRKAGASGVALYFDWPLGVHRFGFDTFRSRSLFARDADVGAPPDSVFPDGQNWGFPPLHPEKSRAEGHLYVRRSLELAMRHADLLRVDHVMGLHRQFWIPSGFEKRDGVYVRYPAEELYAVLTLESHRNRCELVGENLGIVPATVHRCLDEHGLRGIHVLQFSLTASNDPPVLPAPPGAVASLNTHDTPTFAGFCHGRDLKERVEGGLLSSDRAKELVELREAAVTALDRALGAPPGDLALRLALWHALLRSSAADLLVVTLEDLWLEDEPQNVPGRTDLPNWRRKLRYAIADLPPSALQALRKLSHPT
jgi:4-alpha-glucanotransferase